MEEFFGSLATFLGGALGGGVGFLVIALIILVLFVPLALWTHDSKAPVRHSGLERFRASLNTPDEGYNDNIPDEVRPNQDRNQDRIANQGVLRDTATPPADKYPPLGEPNQPI